MDQAEYKVEFLPWQEKKGKEEMIAKPLSNRLCSQCSYYWLNTDDKHLKVLTDWSDYIFNNVS